MKNPISILSSKLNKKELIAISCAILSILLTIPFVFSRRFFSHSYFHINNFLWDYDQLLENLFLIGAALFLIFYLLKLSIIQKKRFFVPMMYMLVALTTLLKTQMLHAVFSFDIWLIFNRFHLSSLSNAFPYIFSLVLFTLSVIMAVFAIKNKSANKIYFAALICAVIESAYIVILYNLPLLIIQKLPLLLFYLAVFLCQPRPAINLEKMSPTEAFTALKEQYRLGLITEEDYMAKRNEIIGKLYISLEKMFPTQALTALKEQYEQGLITEEEYQAKRAEIISKL